MSMSSTVGRPPMPTATGSFASVDGREAEPRWTDYQDRSNDTAPSQAHEVFSQPRRWSLTPTSTISQESSDGFVTELLRTGHERRPTAQKSSTMRRRVRAWARGDHADQRDRRGRRGPPQPVAAGHRGPIAPHPMQWITWKRSSPRCPARRSQSVDSGGVTPDISRSDRRDAVAEMAT